MSKQVFGQNLQRIPKTVNTLELCNMSRLTAEDIMEFIPPTVKYLSIKNCPKVKNECKHFHGIFEKTDILPSYNQNFYWKRIKS